MKVKVVDITGKEVSQLELPAEIFGVTPNTQLLAQYVRVYQHNQRHAAARALTRAEVTGTRAKVWKQKGTGRARHGNRTAPIFVGGGKAHGPKGDQNYKLTMSKRMRRAALISALSARAAEVTVVENFDGVKEKTNSFSQVLSQAFAWKNTKNFVIVLDKSIPEVIRASRNIENVSITQAARLNAYEVLQAKQLVLTQESLNVLMGLLAESSKSIGESN